MTRNVVLLSAVVVLFLVNDPSLAGGYCQDQQKDCDNIGRQETRSQQLSDLNTDFETGSANFWTDASQTGVRWKIENSNSAWELNNPAPQPLVGRNYMRVNRGVSLSYGVAVLRSPTIQIPPSSSWIDPFALSSTVTPSIIQTTVKTTTTQETTSTTTSAKTTAEATTEAKTSPIWTDETNDSKISFDFWIRSKWPQFTNLEV